jgi:hypothetical protein
VALAIVAAIGDAGRFEHSLKLMSYLGLNPSVRQSGPGPAYHGRITKQTRARACSLRPPGPLRERQVHCKRSFCEYAQQMPDDDRELPSRGDSGDMLTPAGALRRRLESAWTQASAHRRRKRGATMKAARQGLRLTPCASPRGRPCAREK